MRLVLVISQKISDIVLWYNQPVMVTAD